MNTTSDEMLERIRELEAAQMAAARSWIPTWVKVLLTIVLILAIGAGAVAGYYHLKHEQAVVLTQEQIKSRDELAKQLQIEKTTAAKLLAEIARVNQKPAELTYYVQAPTVQAAAAQVKKDLDAGTSPANKIPADKTVVTPNTEKQKVDVYRITLDKPRFGGNVLVLAGGTDPIEVGAGPSYKNKDWAANAGGTSRGRFYIMGTKYF